MNSPEQDRDRTTPTDGVPNWSKIGIMASQTTVTQFSQIERLSPVALAYLGDAVYELYVRSLFLMPPKRMTDYHTQVVAQVRAESQANNLKLLEPHLTNSEKEILRRGRNASVSKPRRLAPQIYQQATSLETLIGYLYLTNPKRLAELFSKLEFESI